MKEKKQYKVIMMDYISYEDGNVNVNKYILGVTTAVSEKQAINNMKHRLNIKNKDLYNAYSDGERISVILAEEI